MTADAWGVMILLAMTVALFIQDRIRMDLIALMVICVLALSGWVTPAEAVAGFGHSLVVMIAALFIVGEGLFQTGVAARAGQILLRMGGTNETHLLWVLLPLVAFMSAFMSSTGTVALFIPVVMTLARRSGIPPGRLMIPLAYASLMGGMLTLIGTPPNLAAAAALKDAGLEPFTFFDFTLPGLAIFLAGTVYLIYFARHLLPAGSAVPAGSGFHLGELTDRYGITDQIHLLKTLPDSPLVGKTVAEAGLRTRFEATLFGIRRQGRLISTRLPVLSATRIHAGDELLVYVAPDALGTLCDTMRLDVLRSGGGLLDEFHQDFGVAEVLVRRSAPVIGKTLKEARFRDRYGLSVIGIRRQGQPLAAQFEGTRIAFGDSLLVVGGWRHILDLEQHPDFVILELPVEVQDAARQSDKALPAGLIVLAMLVVMATGWLPPLTTSLLAALAMILSGCVPPARAWQSLNATSLILIAGMLPLAQAMKNTGALDALVAGLTTLLEGQPPLLMLGAFFLITSLLSQFMSNTATTVLVAPIALASAQALGIHPQPFLMGVALAASTAFATPVASPVNTLVLGPGNYRFIDFVKVGLPLQALSLFVALLVIPRFFPF